MINAFPPRVLESLDSMDPFLHFLSDEAADECVNYSPPRVLESLDSMDAFGNSSASFQSHEFLDKFNVNDFDGVVDLETHVATLENRQHQTELAYFNLEPDECANYSTPPSYVSDIAADATCLHRPTPYYPDFQEPFVYPKGDPDAVCLTKTDVELLNPATYINDTIIDFYILYLKNKMQKQKKPSFHFFNSFFYPKLAGDRKSAFRSVRKWTRKVNLFEKDYIFIPVNFKYHWSLIVICHPGEMVNINETEPEKSLRLPCILHMDSIKGYHSGLKDLVQSYLCEEWKERKKDTCGEDLSSRFLNMRFLSVEVPQQENSYDCGLFLLHHLELFLDEAPFNFNPLRITKFSNFLNSNWFPPAEASLKRTFIRRLIYELMENHGSHEGFSPNNGDDCLCSEYNDNRIGGQCPLINGEATFHSGQAIEFAPPFNTSSMVLKETSEHLQVADFWEEHLPVLDFWEEHLPPVLDFWEEQPAKKRRLMHFPCGSDGISTSFTFI